MSKRICEIRKLISPILIVLLQLTVMCPYRVSADTFNPFFTKIGTEDGLSNRKVNVVIQDKRGFIWFGTEDGLNRYDGKNFTVYRNDPNVRSSLSGNIITDIHEDRSGMLWIATSDGGLTKYDYRLSAQKQFRQFKHNPHDPRSIPENGIAKIAEDNRGNLWLATSDSYVVRFSKSTERFVTPVKYGPKAILSLAIVQDTLYAGRAGGGLLKINTGSLEATEDPRYADFYKRLPHVSISSLFKDGNNDLWFGSWDNIVYKYNIKTSTEISFKASARQAAAPADEIVSFAEDREEQIWMAGKHTGLTIYDKRKNSFINLKNIPNKEGTLINDQVNDVYIDRKGIVWVATNNGVSVYNPLFSPFIKNILSQNEELMIYDFYRDEQGRLWIGTSEGIFIRDERSAGFQHKQLYYKGQKLSVTKFFKDLDGTFYLGTDYTLFSYNLRTNQVSPLPGTDKDPVMKQLISSRVVSIVRDTLGGHPVLLVSPYGHFITYYDLAEKKWTSVEDAANNIVKNFGLRDNLVRRFYKDKSGNTWLANYKFGLGVWSKQFFKPVKYYMNDPENSFSLTSNDVYDVAENQNDSLWVSTYGGGVDLFNPKTNRFTHMKESSNLTEGLQLDGNRNLWMICNGHFHKYSTFDKTYTCYDLPSIQTMGGVHGYLYKDNNNHMYAAGKNYYISFDPLKVTRINPELEVFLTDFKIFNVSFSELLSQNTIVLDHSKNFLSIEFSAPNYTGHSVNYSYMLAGFDHDWIDAETRNTAYYANLPGGAYVFKVRASNWKGERFSQFKSIKIMIIPPFWREWWFYLIILFFMMVMGYLIYFFRVQILMKHQSIRNGIAQDLHDQIGSTLSSISVYGEVAKIYQVNGEASKLANILNTISQTSNEMIVEMGDIVWAINPKNDHFDNIVNRINNYAQPLCKAKNINFSFVCDEKLLNSNLGMQTRKNLYLIIKEAINNAIKHAQCKNLSVNIRLYEGIAELEIKDDGIGFDSQEMKNNEGLGSGNGLGNMASRSQELHAEFFIESQPGMGASIRLSFNLNNP